MNIPWRQRNSDADETDVDRAKYPTATPMRPRLPPQVTPCLATPTATPVDETHPNSTADETTPPPQVYTVLGLLSFVSSAILLATQ